jgi:hypothetical protein
MSAHPLFDKVFSGSPDPTVTQLTGKQLRDWGIEDALQRAIRVKNDYVTKCLEAIKSFPSGSLITSEDVREKAGDPPLEISPNCMAGILKRAAAQKLIVITDSRVHAKRSSLHAAELRQWRKL